MRDELQTSSVMVADKIEQLTAPLSPEAMKERPYVLGDSEIMPAADLKFKKTEELQLVFQVYGAKLGADDKKPDVSVDYVFFQKDAAGEKPFNKTPPQTLNAKTLPQNFDPEMGHQLCRARACRCQSSPRATFGWKSRSRTTRPRRASRATCSSRCSRPPDDGPGRVRFGRSGSGPVV